MHHTTVSLALRGHPRIPVATRERIKAEAGALGYRVNSLDAVLMRARRRRTNLAPLPIAWIEDAEVVDRTAPRDPTRALRFAGAVAQAASRSCVIERFAGNSSALPPGRLADLLVRRGIRGVIFEDLPSGPSAECFRYERFAGVALDPRAEELPLLGVTADHFASADLAMERLRERGYRRVGFVLAPEDAGSPAVGRWLGAYFRRQLELPGGDRLAPFGGGPALRAEFAAWLDRQRPDAVIATRAEPVAELLASARRDVPRDVGLVALDSPADSRFAGVRWDWSRIGALAVEAVLDLLHRNQRARGDVELRWSGMWHDGTTLPETLSRRPECAR